MKIKKLAIFSAAVISLLATSISFGDKPFCTRGFPMKFDASCKTSKGGTMSPGCTSLTPGSVFLLKRADGSTTNLTVKKFVRSKKNKYYYICVGKKKS